MKRVSAVLAAVLAAVLVGPALRADVKTSEKTIVKFEGMLGTFINRAAGGADGKISSVALKGNRMLKMGDADGQLVDLTEEKVYIIDVKKKEYSVVTFADMRAQMEEAKKEMAKRQEAMEPPAPKDKEKPQEPAKQLEFDVTVNETGVKKTIAGYDTHEVVMTITMREKGKKLEESGGVVMTTSMMMAARVAALDEQMDFYMRMYKAIYGGAFSGLDQQQMAALSTMVQGMGGLADKMAAERKKLQGTPLLTVMQIENVKSAEQMKALAEQQSSSGSGGGGLSGALARRMMGNRGGPPQARSLMMTTTSETMSIATSVSAADVTIPANFKESKKK